MTQAQRRNVSVAAPQAVMDNGGSQPGKYKSQINN